MLHLSPHIVFIALLQCVGMVFLTNGLDTCHKVWVWTFYLDCTIFWINTSPCVGTSWWVHHPVNDFLFPNGSTALCQLPEMRLWVSLSIDYILFFKVYIHKYSWYHICTRKNRCMSRHPMQSWILDFLEILSSSRYSASTRNFYFLNI